MQFSIHKQASRLTNWHLGLQLSEDAKKLADADAEVLDYGENFIYPGFLESHTHGYLA